MKLVDGVHHVTFLTEDVDRLASFYERVSTPLGRSTCLVPVVTRPAAARLG